MSSSLVLNLAKVIVLRSSLTVCSETHTVTKTGDSPFVLVKISLAESTILTNFSQICQSEIILADLTILTNFRHFVTARIFGNISYS